MKLADCQEGSRTADASEHVPLSGRRYVGAGPVVSMDCEGLRRREAPLGEASRGFPERLACGATRVNVLHS